MTGLTGMKTIYTLLAILLCFCCTKQYAQDDLLSLIDEEEESNIVGYAFKTTRIINLQSIENVHAGVLDFRISHRFGFVNSGIDEFFGLDQSTVRLGLEYGVTDRFMAGIGRSSFEKTLDGFLKYKLVRQKTGAENSPISLSLFTSMAIETIPFADPDRDNFFSSRLSYTWQVLLSRKFSPGFTLQLTPSLVHRNLVETLEEKNDILALGIGTRIKLSSRVTLNGEYIIADKNGLANDFNNSIAIGCDIETGGHVFQLHLTNSTSMIEKGFIAENTGVFFDGDIHFGFNISRVFTLVKPKEFRE